MIVIDQIVTDFQSSSLFVAGVIKYHLVGSTYVCGHGEDTDILLLVDSLEGAKTAAEFDGYEIEGMESYDTSTFYSARKGNVNLLLTQDEKFYDLFVKSAQLCRFLSVTDKADRIMVHRLLMDDELIYPENQ